MAKTNRIAAAVLGAALLGSVAAPAIAGPLSMDRFTEVTGLSLSDRQVTSLWNSMVSMGTTQFLGGSLGSFRLDEASMIAGAATLGVTEFDNFLRTGSLSSVVNGLGSLLTQRMTAAAGADLSHLVGSFTSGGGLVKGASESFASLTSVGGASEASGSCDPEIGDKLAESGEAYVKNVVETAMSEQYGFSQLGGLGHGTPGGGGAKFGFSALSCLDKLFQGANVDILFKPPSLANLTNMLQSWTCDKAVSVAQQIAGAFGDGNVFKTGNLGGFFPQLTFGEANTAAPIRNLAEGASPSQLFGSDFASVNVKSNGEIKISARLGDLFK